MKRLTLAVLLSALLALSGGGWHWGGPPKAKADEPPVVETAAPEEEILAGPVLAEVTEADGTEYIVEVAPTDEVLAEEPFLAEVDIVGDSDPAFVAVVDIGPNWGSDNPLTASVTSWGW